MVSQQPVLRQSYRMAASLVKCRVFAPVQAASRLTHNVVSTSSAHRCVPAGVRRNAHHIIRRCPVLLQAAEVAAEVEEEEAVEELAADDVADVATEEVTAEAVEEEEEVAPDADAEWKQQQLAALEDEEAETFAPVFSVNFLWLEKNIAVSVDQVFGDNQNQRSPVTEYFFWPRKDAWEELKTALEAKPWISERDKVLLLNKTTEVINFWQDEDKKHTIAEAREKFPDCRFEGM